MATRILVIEDEPSIAENISYALTADGFSVVSCATLAEARALLTERFDFIILDVGLPDGTGFEFMRDLRAVHRTPVIFLTARSSEVDRVVGLEIGADDYVTKPFSPRELCARVRTVLRRTSNDPTGSVPAPAGSEGNAVPASGGRADEPATEVRTGESRGDLKNYGPFVVDEHRVQVHFHGVALPLTRYEYRLLQVLILSPGRVFSREQLMNRAWEEPEMSLERTVDAHIKSLRAKLRAAAPEEEDPIVTHRGFGYALREFP